MTRLARMSAVIVCIALATQAHAQGVVISGASSFRYIEMRPLALDSVPFSQTDSAWGPYRLTKSLVLARCTSLDAYCSFFRSANRQGLAALMQDIDITAWGLGEGVSVHAQLRARAAAGAASDLWPQANQNFDALAAYVDIDRSLGRVRAGRQWLTSTLGVFNFDGLDLLVRPRPNISAELYGGGALVEGLNRALDADALAPVEDLPPTDHAYLIGGSARFKPSARGSIAVQYQRAIRADRAALYSERFGATVDFSVRTATVSGQLLRDLATGQNNELSASARIPLTASIATTLLTRHHAPYFDLWTIWGAFSPVGFDEVGADLHYTGASGGLALATSGSWRSYDDTHSGLLVAPMRNDGWHLAASTSARLTTTLRADAGYRADIGFGASGANFDAAVRWTRGGPFMLALRGTAFQTIGEFQVGEGRVFGLGGEGTWDLSPTVRLAADAFLYRHSAHDRPQLVDWNQRRLNVRVEWSLGNEPMWGGRIP